MDYEARARNGKALFDFLADWTAPELPGMAADVVKRHVVFGTHPSALFGNACAVVMSTAIDAVSPEEREALLKLAAYRREVYPNSAMLDAGYGRPERVFANLYDALFAHLAIHGERRDKDYDLYRGHIDSRWRLEASYYRKLSGRQEARDDRTDLISSFFGVHVVSLDDLRGEERARMVVGLRRQYPDVSLEGLEPLQQEAIIQHYLSGTKLLDFTTSIYVAGFFATTTHGPMTENERPPMGAIYRIAPRELDELAVARVEAPELPSRFVRIHRQDGVFLKIRFREAINEPGLWARWVFRHTGAAFPFRSLVHDITSEYLLAEVIDGEM